MSRLSQKAFLETLPEAVRPHLPPQLRSFQVRRPWSGIVQLNYGEPALHYEVGHVAGRPGQSSGGWELGFHFEARDQHLNRLMLDGFRRHLVEIKADLGDGIEAEMWDRGWTKIYEVFPEEDLTAAYQEALAQRLAAIMTYLHPFFVDIRRSAAQVHR